MSILKISVNGEEHSIDYNGLINKPTIPDITGLTSRVASLENNSLPDVTSDDQGKVLTVNSEGEWHPESLDIPEPVDPLPSVTSADQGKVLTVNSSGGWYAANVPSELPSASSSAVGKSLIVDSYGNWALSSSKYGEQISILQRDLDDYQMVTSPKLLPFGESSADEGKILICNGYSWDFSDFTMPALQGQINRLATQLSQLQERVSRLASSLSDTEVYAANETLALSGAGISVSGEKLSIDDTTTNVTGEKLSI